MTIRRAAFWSFVLALLACVAAGSASAESLQPVAPDHVCMVNNTSHAGPQIPVQVGGKTYFGCCEMCKGRLASDPAARTAVDPMSGRPVDKATAVIGATLQGKVMYFENQQSFDSYRAAP